METTHHAGSDASSMTLTACNQREVYQSPACIYKADMIYTYHARIHGDRHGILPVLVALFEALDNHRHTRLLVCNLVGDSP